MKVDLRFIILFRTGRAIIYLQNYLKYVITLTQILL